MVKRGGVIWEITVVGSCVACIYGFAPLTCRAVMGFGSFWIIRCLFFFNFFFLISKVKTDEP